MRLAFVLALVASAAALAPGRRLLPATAKSQTPECRGAIVAFADCVRKTAARTDCTCTTEYTAALSACSEVPEPEAVIELNVAMQNMENTGLGGIYADDIDNLYGYSNSCPRK